MIKILHAVAIIIGFTSTAYAISCHVCYPAIKSTDCDDLSNAGNKHVVDCNTPSKMISQFLPYLPKSVVDIPTSTGCLRLWIESKGEKHAKRVCFFGDVSKSKEFCHQSEMAISMPGNATQLSCDICTDDLCNSSTATGIFAATVLCLVAIVRMMS